MTLIEAIGQRHSVRRYHPEPLPALAREKIIKATELLNRLEDIEFTLVENEPEAFSGLLAYGSFSGVTNYIVITAPKGHDADIKGGCRGELLVLYARTLGLDTCWAGLSYRRSSPLFPKPEKGRRILACIAIGRGIDHGHPHRIKSPGQVSNISADTPEWFDAGVKAALLAPTAVNQQRFRFTYIAPETPGGLPAVRARALFSLAGYTRVDLGIAMLHFKLCSSRALFRWEFA